ncbi:MAG: SlyX family protein [Bacteriovoracaceae bacterium]
MSNDQRIIELEIRFSHQDQFLKDLNEVVVAQQLQIEQLENAIIDLKRSINSEAGAKEVRNLSDERPPHY